MTETPELNSETEVESDVSVEPEEPKHEEYDIATAENLADPNFDAEETEEEV